MRTKVAAIEPVGRLDRILDGLGQELIESTDEELLQAAGDLGMDPTMRGSAAFIGLKYPAIPRMSDFFEVPGGRMQLSEPEEGPLKARRSKGRVSGRRSRHKRSRGGGESDAE